MQQSILLIEDEESLARFVELELQHEGYAVAKRFDGREGLDEALRGMYDLILLDIMLPGLNGLEVLRRKAAAPAADLLRVGPVALDPLRHIVTVNGQEVTLTGREFQLLQYMMENEDIVLSRETLLSTVWGYDYLGETNVVDVYIRYLRQKIDETHHVKTLHTIRGVGYVMKAEDSHV